MTDIATDAHLDDEEHGQHDAAHAHPSEGSYWTVFVALVILTAIEVAWSYLGFGGPSLVLPLVALMVVKFLLVAGAFMHLYFDMKIINGRLFAWTFGSGLVLAGAVYAVVFAAFEFQI